MNLSVFQQLIKALPRRKIAALAATHGSDKWVKRFSTYDHLLVMIFAQLAGQTSLRDLEASFNASPARHYHLGGKPVKRSTLCDANAARSPAVFEAILSTLLATGAGRAAKDAGAMLRVLNSTTIGLFAKTHRALRFRANNSGIKLHLLFDPDAACPTWFQITPARLHDSRLCDALPLQPDATYVFDRAYNNASFWADIDDADALFVTRAKTNLAYDVEASTFRPNSIVIADETIRLAREPGRKYAKPLRRVAIFDETILRELVFITNDFERSAEAIADLYRRRWEIELFFKWIKQNLRIKRFLARNPKAIRLQIITALIAYLLLKILHQKQRIAIPLKRLAALAKNYILNLHDIMHLAKPIERPPDTFNVDQLILDFPGQ